MKDGKCTERHYGDTLWRCDLERRSKKREDRKTYVTKTKMQKTMLHEMPPLITRQRMMAILRKHPIYPPSYSINNTDIIMKNFEIS